MELKEIMEVISLAFLSFTNKREHSIPNSLEKEETLVCINENFKGIMGQMTSLGSIF